MTGGEKKGGKRSYISFGEGVKQGGIKPIMDHDGWNPTYQGRERGGKKKEHK